ncbi:hypothetical protein QZH41_017346 [Actinostola sp. cb2023]|nr:hypothetical protein QZH41_017346 [Actinostola sp. cb2023]
MPDYCLVAGLGCAALSGLFYTFYKSKNDVITSLQSAVQVAFGSELSNALEGSEDHTLPYVAITGEAQPKTPSDVLSSDNVPELQCLVKKVHTYELKSEWGESTRVWYDVKRLLNSVTQSVPFKLCSSDESVLVTEPLSANNLELQNVYDRFEPITPNTAQSILQWASGDKTKGFQTVERSSTHRNNTSWHWKTIAHKRWHDFKPSIKRQTIFSFTIEYGGSNTQCTI